MTINSEIKAEWVSELRSGKYAPGKGQLAAQDGDGTPAKFCCLGVLCEIALRHGVVERKYGEYEEYDDLVKYGAGDGYFEGGVLPAVVRDWAGLARANPQVTLTGAEWNTILGGPDDDTDYRYPDDANVQIDLAGINDGYRHGNPFPFIADLIERDEEL